ncbi:hypothetical protein EVAR_30372_1 [Eumeta japonica]|uniref:Uncharacterized protein n=1 Tax=Eumeta variegata TaxID=151549 RepID=A0A4C1W5F9_EUMVA|nr:hypothetical protein EVAR_30372_1 [Eumeta japonica]
MRSRPLGAATPDLYSHAKRTLCDIGVESVFDIHDRSSTMHGYARTIRNLISICVGFNFDKCQPHGAAAFRFKEHHKSRGLRSGVRAFYAHLITRQGKTLTPPGIPKSGPSRVQFPHSSWRCPLNARPQPSDKIGGRRTYTLLRQEFSALHRMRLLSRCAVLKKK